MTFQEVSRCEVVDQFGGKVNELNEIEYLNGYIYSNIWFTNLIYKIDAEDCSISRIFDLTPLFEK